jgi:hypothetical protein
MVAADANFLFDHGVSDIEPAGCCVAAAEGARAADAPLADDFPAFLAFAAVRRRQFRRRDGGESRSAIKLRN